MGTTFSRVNKIEKKLTQISYRDYATKSTGSPKMDKEFTGFVTLHRFGRYRIGPHNVDILGLVLGSLLGQVISNAIPR